MFEFVDTDEVLGIENADSVYCLSNLIEGRYLDMMNEMNEPFFLQSSPYYDNDAFIEIMKTKHDEIKIMSLNCQSLNAKHGELRIIIENCIENNGTPDIICLQETWLTENHDLSLLQLPGYQLVSQPRSCSAHGGVAIYLLDDMRFSTLSVPASQLFDGLFIEISLESTKVNDKLVIGNIYRPPRANVDNINAFIDEFQQIIALLNRKRHVIITGDFNLDLLKYAENSHINDFLELHITHGFIPKITLPTRVTQMHGTLIDNIFHKVADGFPKCTSGILLSGISDHYPYFTILDFLKKSKINEKYISLLPNFDVGLPGFKEELSSVLNINNGLFHHDLNSDPNINYEFVNRCICDLLQKYFPRKLVKFRKYRHKKSKWITHGILRSIFYKDKLYSKLKAMNPLDPHYIEVRTNYKTYNSILKKCIRLAKKQYYENVFKQFKSDIKKTWGMINSILNKSDKKTFLPDFFLINGQRVTDKQVISDEFNKYYTEVGIRLANSIEVPPGLTFQSYLADSVIQQFDFKLVNRNDVLAAIDSLNSKTSSGFDGLSTIMLKSVKYEVCDSLTLIINQSLTTGLFPEKLKIAKVIPLHKGDDKSDISNYRPISMLSSVSKVFERIIHDQLYQYFDSNKLFYHSQYGFRKQRSTELAALELVEYILTEMDKNETPINVYLDLSKAFDTLDHDILLHKLIHYGLKEKATDLLRNYLQNRTQFVAIDNISSAQMPLKVGVPQGSILGPLLFIIYVNDMTSATRAFHPIIYADDTTLAASLNSFVAGIEEPEVYLNDELQKVSNWMKANKLSINKRKTKAMVFHTPQRRILHPSIRIDNTDIEYVTQFNFLGIIIDKNLNWKAHKDMISKRISKFIGVINKLKNTIPQSALLHIYNSLVQSHLTYGMLLWGRKCNEIFTLQKKAIRAVTNAGFNSHTSALFKGLNILKFPDLCTLQEYKFCYKRMNNQLPEYFNDLLPIAPVAVHSYGTRFGQHFRMPRIRHEFARMSICYRYISSLNNMPDNFRVKLTSHSYQGFKNYVKTMFIANYSILCDSPGCYICSRS